MDMMKGQRPVVVAVDCDISAHRHLWKHLDNGLWVYLGDDSHTKLWSNLNREAACAHDAAVPQSI